MPEATPERGARCSSSGESARTRMSYRAARDVTSGKFAQRLNTSSAQFLKPGAPAGDGLDQRRIISLSVFLLAQSRQHEPGSRPRRRKAMAVASSIVLSPWSCAAPGVMSSSDNGFRPAVLVLKPRSFVAYPMNCSLIKTRYQP